ncbi:MULTISPECIES: phage tail protein [unclassified Bradyrhizobium]|uniref:phage tail protein n=1 Tax=unclassified Bradyrhizobium TaxID=2631580 RepID=UPI001FFB56F8|nr:MULTISPECIES: phage tail protein [unclassified Bradyrhizobium]MCK1611036.1 phage tail protein [Bradyrhizobium sp. 163]MCK1762790.1 phage tail protein [Bradyrhizobium sp. 136]
MAELKVTIDGSKLEKWATELSARGMRNAIRRAVDKSATAARKIALDIIAKDIGVPKARIKDGVTKVKRTTQTSLSASFTANKMRINMLATGASVARPGGMTGSTFRLTGGGSASLKVRDAFLVSANGGTFIAIRRSKSRLPIKGVFAETPSTALGQDGAAARKAWDKAANSELATRLPQEIQKQLLAEGLPYSAPPDSD